MLQGIFAEATPDFSAELCAKATLADLNPSTIEDFRKRWLRKLRDSTAPTARDHAARIATFSSDQLLEDAELLVDGGVTYAALVLFGTHQALGKYLAHAEVVFEYRFNDVSGPASDRAEFREGFFAFYDALWNRINLRNDRQPFQEHLFVLEIATFNERAIREAVLNAVSHRAHQPRRVPVRLEGKTFKARWYVAVADLAPTAD